MPLLKSEGGVIHYERHGKGEPLVILRGLSRSVRHWLGFEHELAKHFDVLTVELRGIGQSTAPWTWKTTLFDIADDVASVLDAEGIAKAHVMGVSLGGMVTLAFGLRHPERAASLAVINTSIAGQLVPRLSGGAIFAILKAARRRDPKEHGPMVDLLVGHDCLPEHRRSIADRYAEIAVEDGLYGDTALRQLASAGRFLVKRQLRHLKPPTLIIYGTQDRFVPNLNSRKLAALIPNSTLIPLPGGHELSLDQGPALIKTLQDWTVRVG